MSTGGKWVRIRVPSMPSQWKVWCGNVFVCDQEIFCVSSHLEPAA